MKIDAKTYLILSLVAVVVVLILIRGCGKDSIGGKVDIQLIYDSIEQVITSQLPPPDTIFRVSEKTVVKWLPSATVQDTIYVKGETIYVYNDAPIDSNDILTHYLTQAVTYIDTIRDSALQAIISDVIFRNQIRERDFRYKILRPVEVHKVDNRDRFQLIASFQAGGGMTYANTPNYIGAGVDVGLKFKNGTYFSVGYMAGSSHFATIRAGQVIRFRKR